MKRPASSQAEPRVLFTAGCVLASALGLTLAGAWACSSAESAEPAAQTVQLGSESSAPSIAVPWLPESLAPFRAALVEAAQRHDVDPALVAIVTLVESMGDPRAVSPGGARGLMQLMPSTAASIASQRQLADHSDERLFEPEYNLDLGAFLLSQLLKSHGSVEAGQRSVELAAVEYNAGPRLTSAYLAGTGALPEETARYRDLVVALWNERLQPESPSFSAWQARLKPGQ